MVVVVGRRMVWLLVLVGLVALAGCGKGDKAGEDPGVEVPDLFEPADLVFYSASGNSEDVFNDKYGNAIREKFPHYTISYLASAEGVRYPDVAVSGTQIDIVYESIGQFPSGPLEFGLAMDMEPLIRRHNVDLSRLEQTSLEAMRGMTGGTLNGLPVFTNTSVLYYNKGLFDRFGVSYPQDGMNWDEVHELHRYLTRVEDGIQYGGMSIENGHYLRTNPFSLTYVTPDNKAGITQHENMWRLFYETFRRASDAPGYADRIRQSGLYTTNDFLVNHTVAMRVALTAMPINRPAEFQQMEWDVTALPVYKEYPALGPTLYPSYFSVSSTSRYPDQALDVIHFLLSDEFQMDWSRQGNMPAVHTPQLIQVFAEDAYFKDKNVKNAFFPNFSRIADKSIYEGQVEARYTAHIRALMQGDIDMNTMMRTIEEEVNQIIASLEQK